MCRTTPRKARNFTRVIRDIFWQHFGNCVFCPATITKKIEDMTGYMVTCEDSTNDPNVKVLKLKTLFMVSTDSLAVLDFTLNSNSIITDIQVYDEYDR